MNTTEAQSMMLMEMKRFGLHDWKFEWSSSARRFGACFTAQKKLTLSWQLVSLNSVEQVRDTVLHEIAHALTPGDHHGWMWQRKCIEIGAKPIRCYDRTVTQPPKTWEMYCPKCNLVFKQYHNHVSVEGKYHTKCSTLTEKAFVKMRLIKRG